MGGGGMTVSARNVPFHIVNYHGPASGHDGLSFEIAPTARKVGTTFIISYSPVGSRAEGSPAYHEMMKVGTVLCPLHEVGTLLCPLPMLPDVPREAACGITT
jgi:hypothetical protein